MRKLRSPSIRMNVIIEPRTSSIERRMGGQCQGAVQEGAGLQLHQLQWVRVRVGNADGKQKLKRPLPRQASLCAFDRAA